MDASIAGMAITNGADSLEAISYNDSVPILLPTKNSYRPSNIKNKIQISINIKRKIKKKRLLSALNLLIIKSSFIWKWHLFKEFSPNSLC